jgi:carbonyl reductase 1
MTLPADACFNLVEEGARVPLKLALEDIDGTTGKYWANDSISGTGSGKVQKW